VKCAPQVKRLSDDLKAQLLVQATPFRSANEEGISSILRCQLKAMLDKHAANTPTLMLWVNCEKQQD